MSERAVLGLGISALFVAIASVAFIVDGGLIALPLAVVLGATASLGGLMKHPPRPSRVQIGIALGALTVIAVFGFAFYGIVIA